MESERAATRVVDEDIEQFVLDVAQALHRYGMPAYRIEDALLRVGRRLGVELAVFSTPTGLTIGFGPLIAQRSRLIRVQPGSVSLARVAELSDLIDAFVCGGSDLAAARARIAALEHEPPPHGGAATAAAFGLASAASAALFHASLREVAASAAIGLLVGMLHLATARSERIARLFEVLAAALAAALACIAHRLAPEIGSDVVTLAAIIVLVPGYTLTLALNELASGHLSSGTARFGGAVTTMMLLGCGTAIGSVAFHGLAAARGAAPPPAGAEWIALAVAPLAFKVLFQARHVDLAWIVLASAVAFSGTRIGADLSDPLLGAGIGAFALGVGSNLLARVRRAPSAITAVPGLLVLVPGSIGFRGVSSFLEHDAVSGVDLVFRMIATATVIVCGLLLANVVVSSKRSL